MGEANFKSRFRELYDLSGCPSVTQFAKALDMNRQSVDRYYNGERCPDASALVKICKQMNISADWLLGLSNIRTTSADLHNAVNALGISEKAAERIIDPAIYGNMRDTLSRLLEADLFWNVLHDFYLLFNVIDTGKEDTVEYSSSGYQIKRNKNGSYEVSYSELASLIQSKLSAHITFLCNDIESK